jgi:hypothetical protein
VTIALARSGLLDDLPHPWEDGSDVHVPTHCLYPGGGQVVVVVRPGHDGMLVTDDGLGWTTLLSAALDPSRRSAQHAAAAVADRFDLVLHDKRAFLLDGVAPGEVASAVLYVANASQAWVSEVIAALSERMPRDLGERATAEVIRLFGRERVQLGAKVGGVSTKSHDVAMLLILPHDRRAVIEPVTNHPNAIATTYMKFGDIGHLHADWHREAIIEDLASWRSEDVALLADVGTGVTDMRAGLDRLLVLNAA